jgi:adenylate cyclase class 2
MKEKIMRIEYEAKFTNIDVESFRKVLQTAGAELIKPEFLQKRTVFFFPQGNEVEGGWARVRDEGDKVTMSIKVVNGVKIEDQKEICLTVDSFEQAQLFLETLGCKQKSYQETKRELWMLDGVEIMIDTWPFFEPFVEIEGKSEEEVKHVAEKLGFEWTQAIFGAMDLYTKKYSHVTLDRMNNHTPLIVFGGKNPFENK